MALIGSRILDLFLQKEELTNLSGCAVIGTSEVISETPPHIFYCYV